MRCESGLHDSARTTGRKDQPDDEIDLASPELLGDLRGFVADDPREIVNRGLEHHELGLRLARDSVALVASLEARRDGPAACERPSRGAREDLDRVAALFVDVDSGMAAAEPRDLEDEALRPRGGVDEIDRELERRIAAARTADVDGAELLAVEVEHHPRP